MSIGGEPIPGIVPPDVVATQPFLNVNDLIGTKLAERKIAVPKIESSGVAALLGTNETVADGFLEELRLQEPDGYFVGIGLGHALAILPQLYPVGKMPRGVILADIDPRVVAVGHILFEAIAVSPDVATFSQRFFGQSEEAFLAGIQLLKGSFPEALYRQVDNLGETVWRKMYQGIQRDAENSKNFGDIWKSPFKQGIPTDIIYALKDPQLFRFYKTLLERGDITIEYTDFTNPDFIQAVRELPDFSTSRNVIYTSNIVDHIAHRGNRLDNLKLMDRLRQLEDSDQEPIFIDALQANNYYLRATDRLPTYQASDFKRTLASWLEKPAGLLFVPQAVDLEHMDIATLPDRVLRRYYERFMQSEAARTLITVAEKYFHLKVITDAESFFYLSSERSFRRARFEELKVGNFDEEGRKYKEKQSGQEALEHPSYSEFLWGNKFEQFSALYLQMRRRRLL